MQSEKNLTQQYSLVTRLCLAGGVVGPVLFVLAFLIEGATRSGYDVWRTQVSYLALSNQGWEQIANFLVCGVLCIAFAVGLRRIWRTGRSSVWGPLLVGLFGLGLVIAGVFVADPGEGYPAGASLEGIPHTWHGWVHGINGVLFFLVVLPAMCFVLAQRFAADPQTRHWATYSRVTGTLILLISVLSSVPLPIAEHAGFPVVDGLIQRGQIIIGWAWLALTALRLLQEARQPMSDEDSTHIAVANAHVS